MNKDKKYYVTNDLEYTTNGLGAIENGDLSFIRCLLKETLEEVFPGNVEIIDYRLMKDFLSKYNYGISLDEVYANGNTKISMTRIFESIDDILGGRYDLGTRLGGGIAQEIETLKRKLSLQDEGISLIDDGIFSGSTLRRVIKELNKQGIPIDNIIVGLNLLGNDVIDDIPITSLKKDNGCIDRIDERDFFYGIDLGGASMKYNDVMVGVPYTYTNKILERKSSIPNSKVEGIRRKILGINQELFECIDLNIKLVDIPRLAFMEGLYPRKKRIIDILEEEKKK